jgi:hypothetical protein
LEQEARGVEKVSVMTGPERPPSRSQPYPAEKARGGEIILRTPVRRMIFTGGLVGAVALLIALAFLR